MNFLDWTFDNPGKTLLVLFSLIAALIYFGSKADAEARRAFMSECTQHRERYECVAMWRAGGRNNTYIPVVVPVR